MKFEDYATKIHKSKQKKKRYVPTHKNKASQIIFHFENRSL